MESGTILVAVFATFAVLSLILISRIMNKGKDNKGEEKEQGEPELTKRFYMGQYLGGFQQTNEPAPLVFCGVTEDSFVFCKGTQGVEIGRVPRTFIRNVGVSANGKKGSSLSLEWSDAGGSKHTASFNFADKNSMEQATQAAETIKTWIKK